MNISYKLYSEDLPYDGLYNTQEENEIIEFIKSHKNMDYEEDMKKNYNVYFQNELSIRNLNSINWYPMEKGKKVLEVLGRFGTITEYLLNKDMKVTCIETVKSRAKINNERNQCENLSIICTSDILNCNIKEKYDYIVLFNVIENAKAIINNINISTKNAVKLLMDKLTKLLTEDGKLLIYTDNRFAIRNFAGYKTIPEENAFSSIVDKNKSKINKYFSKSEIINIFEELNISNYKFYYPLPDCKNASVIYSDEYLPSVNSSKLKYNIYYNKYSTIVFNEIDAIIQLTKNGYFDIFANSYVIEIAKEKCSVNFVGFNNFRKKDYQLITIMEKDKITKLPCSKFGSGHIENIKNNIDILNKLKINTLDSYSNKKINSRYTDSKSLDAILFEKIINENEVEYLKEIEKWYAFINEKLISNKDFESIKEDNIFKKYDVKISDEEIKELNFTETGFLDMVFENIFVIDEKYYIYDQEWYEKNIPFEYILYRAIQSLYFHNTKIQHKYEKEKLFKHFNLENYLELFEKLENKWQESIVDNETRKFFETTYSALTTLEELKSRSNDADFYSKIIESLNNTIEEIKDEKETLAKELNEIKSSKYWNLYQKYFLRKDNDNEK